MRINLFVIIQFLITVSAVAQPAMKSDTVTDLSLKWQNLSLKNPWLLTANAAGLKGGAVPAIGTTFVGTYQEVGDFRRPQEASSKSYYTFHSERYQPVKKGVFYGSFRFEQQKENGIHWNDLLDPYRGTPYILADSLGGDWKKQVYKLNLKAASAQIADRLALGAGLVYNLSTGARQNDPRPLNYVNELDFKPSLLFEINKKHSAGLTGTYGFYKEEVSLMNNKSELLQKVFKLKGLAVHDAPALFSNSFTRLYDGKKKGADVQYAWSQSGSSDLKWLTSLGWEDYSEDVRDGVTKPTNGGKFNQTTYHLTSTLQRSNSGWMQQLQISFLKKEGKGREYHQTYDPVSTVWITTFEAIFYTSEATRADISWELVKQAEYDGFNWKVKASAGYNKYGAQYLYTAPVSQNLETANMRLDGQKAWSLKSRNSILLSINAGYQFPLTNGLDYTLKQGSANQAINKILLPDHAYLAASAVKAGLAIQYTFASNKPDAKFHNQFYIKGSGEIAAIQKSETAYKQTGNRQNFALTIGAFY
ncbi:DUF6850 family outer membrane beta-barrel protein [Dyadobacter sp. LHD-138]|uniref:DUF6850 family outer membrane beta-barrel protein n=1 Tax=Dyadobacter sp. LHD-138 TaxID=3071413 RepID=UPI0027E1B18C|nr:DUF6850 family outer membrane beta-barrel protein [Dyadobacter sp. LHD-138]MDQ6481842.1 hypothetical protein [Dyadobacter sp. LHD-138]